MMDELKARVKYATAICNSRQSPKESYSKHIDTTVSQLQYPRKDLNHLFFGQLLLMRPVTIPS